MRHLPYFMAAGGGPASLGAHNISSSGGSAASITLTLPACRGGDLLVGFVAASTAARTYTPPAGWSERLDASGLTIATWRVTGTIPSTVVFTPDSNAAMAGGIIAVHNGVFDVVGTTNTASPIVAPAVVLTKAGLLFGFYRANNASCTFSTPAGMTALDLYNTSNISLASFEQSVAAGDTGTRSSTITGTPGAQAGALIGIRGTV